MDSVTICGTVRTRNTARPGSSDCTALTMVLPKVCGGAATLCTTIEYGPEGTPRFQDSVAYHCGITLSRKRICFTSPTTPTTRNCTQLSKIFPWGFCRGQNVLAMV